MINQKRNEKTFYYALFSGNTAVMKDGLYTGEYEVSYGTPVECRGNISASRGMSDHEVFGTGLDYDRVIVTHDMSCPIDENSILWIDCTPANNTPYDFIVRRVAKSLNHISIAVRRVMVDEDY